MLTDFILLMKHELILILLIFILLILKIRSKDKNEYSWLIFINVFIGICVLYFITPQTSGQLFGTMYITNPTIHFEKMLLILGTFLISLFSFEWIKKHPHGFEFYILLISTLLGMYYMLSAGNFLMLYLGLELASIPLAALVNFDIDSRKSSEGAMKMILSSAFSSAILLFGISLLYGSTGSLDIALMTQSITGNPLEILGLIMVFCGFAFKLSAVPFHFWTADVYQGAPVHVTSYLSVISKAAITFIFISTLSPLFNYDRTTWYHILSFLILVTITTGNLFALRQENIKRFLAFSSIAQAGYIMLGMLTPSAQGHASVVYFLFIYIFSNLGVFGVATLLQYHAGIENIQEMRGLYKNNKWIGWALGISLFSLAGVPPTAGFFGKLFLIASGGNTRDIFLLTVVSLNMVISLYYYLRIVKGIFMDQSTQSPATISVDLWGKTGLLICLSGIIFAGINGAIFEYILHLF